MDIIRLRALRGPNLWSRYTAIEATVRCEPPELDLHQLSHFEERLRERFPELGVLPEPTADGVVTMAHALEICALALQTLAGCPVSFSRTVAAPEAGVYQVVVEYTVEEVGRLAFETAVALLQAARDDRPFDTPGAIARLKELDEDLRLGPSTGSIVEAAVARDIPYRRLTTGSLVQLGWGSKQRRIQAAECDTTSAIAESIAQDKELTKKLLHAAGVPVPLGRPVRDAEDAWRAAQELGGAVVVKPRDGNQGKGVTVNVQTREQVLAAFEAASHYGSEVMVERYLPGIDFRLLVVGRQLVAAARRDPPLVIGDGVHTVRELVDAVNADPRRGDGHATPLTRIRLDDIAIDRLAQQGLTPDSVPPRGMRVVLRNNANLSTGGTATDVTDEVHPLVAQRAVAAAVTVGLDVCGVDVVCQSVVQPLEAQQGGIVEVNAAPGLRMHLSPSFGKGRNVGKAIIDHMFPPGEDGRIPLIAVTGTNGKTTTVRLTAHLLRQRGWRVGFTDTNGVYVNGRQIDSGDCSGPKSARRVLAHPDVDAAVLETARGGILREGLAFDRCQVAVVTNIGTGDHLGLNYITTVEDVSVLKRVIVQNVPVGGMAVLNAADPHCVAMAEFCAGQITYFGPSAHHPVIATHRALGKRVVFVEDGHIVAAEGGWQVRVPLAQIPLTEGGTLAFQVDNTMAAIAAAWAVGVPWEAIARGLETFTSDAHTVPGRFNRFTYRGATLIADYGHNPDAIAALCRAVEAMPAGKRVVVISAAGDRRDQDIVDQARLVGQVFDEVVLFEDACQRGRADGEVIALLQQGLQDAPKTRWQTAIRGEFVAIDTALARLQPGDLCLILVDQVEEALAHIARRVAETPEAAAAAS
ncbi:cyanophycin synthetase [Zoogloeaceae bacteirum Par-f-2]|jgi:cyanophycin synthetase|uniref:cyanophycin synthetase n=1 Tax=Pseudothauera hydrothermalis TaxID=2184083 RepID=UPI000D25A0F8|nr:cyanophycin synthetase [Pseudothauera hydrothermalis]AVZ78037.1 cyanophycin synthetase [Zoogloeaceae bacteirum Par-f-2]